MGCAMTIWQLLDPEGRLIGHDELQERIVSIHGMKGERGRGGRCVHCRRVRSRAQCHSRLIVIG